VEAALGGGALWKLGVDTFVVIVEIEPKPCDDVALLLLQRVVCTQLLEGVCMVAYSRSMSSNGPNTLKST
jgi:hypothetical protein